MKIIGLTGGIASGKSTASNILKTWGLPVIDGDVIARKIVDIGESALEEIKNTFGNKVIRKDGSLNRKLLGEIVFSDKESLEKLNNITHSRIIEEILNKIEMYRKMDIYPVIIVDAALLIEMNIKKYVDEVWLIVVDKEIQLNRLMERDHLSIEDAHNRINSQMPMEKKKKYADIIIDNNNDIKYLESELKKHLEVVKKKSEGYRDFH